MCKEKKVLQKDAAKHLGITPAPVSFYVSGKRGSDIEPPKTRK